MIEQEKVKQLADIAMETLARNKSMLESLKYHQEMICATSDSLVRIVQTPHVPLEILMECQAMMRRLMNFQKIMLEKANREWS